ncbi:c-type cytochrome biogenesis protein CcmI [Maritalea myrionectae]|uniref:c-type cytochrome biogenesis protein CcmI n=1 Tax=Maritalea myrionectae TaxID=454601 RepID=UPI00055B5104|nr:c-type cytochrome biogenesis protein CcmI [Maritalea myrionectae]
MSKLNSFWLTAILLASVVALVLLISSRSRGQKHAADHDEDHSTQNADAAFYKSQLKALETDKESGLLDDEQFRVARAELAREALASQKQAQNKNAQGQWSLAYTLVALVAFMAIGLGTYYYLGTPALKNQPLATRLAAIENLDVDDAVAKIETQLQATPDDIRGWRVLVPVYVRQGAIDKAIIAFENIARIEGENAENITDLAEAHLMKADGKPTPEALELLEKATNLDPRHVRSRFYLANIALNNDEFELAKKRWLDILELAEGDEPWISSAQNGLAAARAGLGEIGPSQDDVAAAAEMDEADRNEMIAQMVKGLAERLYEDGGTVDEWARLIRSRVVLGQLDVAEQDIARARAAFENNQSSAAALEQAIAQDVEQIEKDQSE